MRFRAAVTTAAAATVLAGALAAPLVGGRAGAAPVPARHAVPAWITRALHPSHSPAVTSHGVAITSGAYLSGYNIGNTGPNFNALATSTSAIFPTTAVVTSNNGTTIDLQASNGTDTFGLTLRTAAAFHTGVYGFQGQYPGATNATVTASGNWPGDSCSGGPSQFIGGIAITQIAYDNPAHVASIAAQVAVLQCYSTFSGTFADHTPNTTPGQGFYLFGPQGDVSGFGNDQFLSYLGSPIVLPLNQPIVAMATTHDDNGYWMTAADGGVFAYGNAGFYGSTGNITLNQPIVGMAATPDGRGYWFTAADGGVFAYGDAAFYGSMGGTPLNRPIVGMAATHDGKGYWLIAADGGVFAYGDAAFYGSTGNITLNQPIVGITASADGNGYRFVAADGGIFSYGDAAFYGSTGGSTLNAPVVGMETTPDGGGYWLVGSDGSVYNFGDAPFENTQGLGAGTNVLGYGQVAGITH